MRTDCFPLMREINKVVFAAPSSFQESGIESVATLAADFRSSWTWLPHLLRVLFARFPGETAIEHTRRSLRRDNLRHRAFSIHPSCSPFFFSTTLFVFDELHFVKRCITTVLESEKSYTDYELLIANTFTPMNRVLKIESHWISRVINIRNNYSGVK